MWQDITFNGPELDRQTSCSWVEEERRVHELSGWCPEIFGNVHADTAYRWKLDGPGSGGGKPKKISGAVAEKLSVLTRMTCLVKVLVCRSRSCVPSSKLSREGRFECEIVA